MSNAKHIRQALGLSQVVVAVRAGVSPPTLRAYELDPFGVSATKREAIARTYRELAAEVSDTRLAQA